MFKVEDGILKVVNTKEFHQSGKYTWTCVDHNDRRCPMVTWHRKATHYIWVNHFPKGDYGEPEEFMVILPGYLTKEHWLLIAIAKGNGGVFDATLSGNDITFTNLEDLNNTFEEFIKELSEM